jgi:hypothetical protein
MNGVVPASSGRAHNAALYQPDWHNEYATQTEEIPPNATPCISGWHEASAGTACYRGSAGRDGLLGHTPSPLPSCPSDSVCTDVHPARSTSHVCAEYRARVCRVPRTCVQSTAHVCAEYRTPSSWPAANCNGTLRRAPVPGHHPPAPVGSMSSSNGERNRKAAVRGWPCGFSFP